MTPEEKRRRDVKAKAPAEALQADVMRAVAILLTDAPTSKTPARTQEGAAGVREARVEGRPALARANNSLGAGVFLRAPGARARDRRASLRPRAASASAPVSGGGGG
jgi:hypothetical protein